jgi:hypothetical protein
MLISINHGRIRREAIASGEKLFQAIRATILPWLAAATTPIGGLCCHLTFCGLEREAYHG